MTEPRKLLREGRAGLNLPQGVQYVAREADAERAQEIAGEFYPNLTMPTSQELVRF